MLSRYLRFMLALLLSLGPCTSIASAAEQLPDLVIADFESLDD